MGKTEKDFDTLNVHSKGVNRKSWSFPVQVEKVLLVAKMVLGWDGIATDVAEVGRKEVTGGSWLEAERKRIRVKLTAAATSWWI